MCVYKYIFITWYGGKDALDMCSLFMLLLFSISSAILVLGIAMYFHWSNFLIILFRKDIDRFFMIFHDYVIIVEVNV